LNRDEKEGHKPWVLAKDPAKKDELRILLANIGEWLAHIAVLLLPFMPETAKKILERLKLKTDWKIQNEKDFCVPFLKSGMFVLRGEALFPRLDEKTS